MMTSSFELNANELNNNFLEAIENVNSNKNLIEVDLKEFN